MYEIQGPFIYSRAILVTVTSEYRVKRIICKTWTGTLANSADPDQTLQNAASDQGLQYLLKLQEVKGSGPFFLPTLRDNRPTSAVRALFQHFPHTNVWGRKFDLAVKRSMVILGSSFEQP